MKKSRPIVCSIPDADSMRALGRVLIKDLFCPDLEAGKNLVACVYGAPSSGKTSIFGVEGTKDISSAEGTFSADVARMFPSTPRYVDMGRMYFGWPPSPDSLSRQHVTPITDREGCGKLDIFEHASSWHLIKDADYAILVSAPSNVTSKSPHNTNKGYFAHMSSALRLGASLITGLSDSERGRVEKVGRQMDVSKNDASRLAFFEQDQRIVRIVCLSEEASVQKTFDATRRDIQKRFPSPVFGPRVG